MNQGCHRHSCRSNGGLPGGHSGRVMCNRTAQGLQAAADGSVEFHSTSEAATRAFGGPCAGPRARSRVVRGSVRC